MAKRKERTRVVLDTSVLGRAWTSPNPQSASVRVYRLWLFQQLQLVVSPELAQEYEATANRVNDSVTRTERFMERLRTRDTVTWANLGRRIKLKRDPKDEHVLSISEQGRVEFLITLDRDMLEIDWQERRRFKFEIVTPAQFLERIA